jgi:tRNA pseudouridine55 synthase
MKLMMQTQMQRRIPISIDGILLVDKPKGLSSNAVLQRAKRLFNAKKAGHTGSLDPLATGMLPVCFGEATKFSQYLLDADKAYDVTACLGATTNTGDAEGDIVTHVDTVQVSMDALNTVLQQFTGPIQQVPPMYSALKHQGRPLYEYARRGVTLERPARAVHIHALQCRGLEGKTLHLTVKCSKGTYIRSLVESIGEALGVGGAYVTSLHRTYTAGFESAPMWSLEALEEEASEARLAHLLPMDIAVMKLPRLDVTLDMVVALRCGKVIADLDDASIKPGLVRLYEPTGTFLGLGDVMDDGSLQVKRLLAHSVA